MEQLHAISTTISPPAELGWSSIWLVKTSKTGEAIVGLDLGLVYMILFFLVQRLLVSWQDSTQGSHDQRWYGIFRTQFPRPSTLYFGPSSGSGPEGLHADAPD